MKTGPASGEPWDPRVGEDSAVIRLLVADDHPVVREGLKRLVGECDDMEVVGEAGTGDEILAMVHTHDADVVLLDVSMPGPGLLETIRRLQATKSRLRILVLSVQPEEQYAKRALRAGANGYLMKNHTPEELVGAIRKVFRGGTFISSALAERLVFELDSRASPPHEVLSDREHQVLSRLASGESIKEIGARLSLSPKTISSYRARILEKLELKTTADLIRYGIKHGLDS